MSHNLSLRSGLTAISVRVRLKKVQIEPKYFMRPNLHDQKQAQRKLQIVKNQLYGTQSMNQKLTTSKLDISRDGSDSKTVFSFKSTEAGTSKNLSSDTGYLTRDLYKIFILSTIAIGTQVGLWLAISKNLLKLY